MRILFEDKLKLGQGRGDRGTIKLSLLLALSASKSQLPVIANMWRTQTNFHLRSGALLWCCRHKQVSLVQ
ncbi:MAG: hypothetical protein QGF59_09270, partial [Pirellulaceae bacterium]|nr:hypothetical protein [Pirellulaceae bacterium]